MHSSGMGKTMGDFLGAHEDFGKCRPGTRRARSAQRLAHHPLAAAITRETRNLAYTVFSGLRESVWAVWGIVTVLPTCRRSEEHTYELQSLMRNSYAVFSLKK